MTENVPDVLDLLIRNELAIKRLYEAFAALFPERQSFWRRIAGDEARHAHWLETLQGQPAFRRWFLSGSRLRPQAIEASIGYVGAQTEKARLGGFTLLEALSVSTDLEAALLEKQFTKMRGSAPPQIRSILTDLETETGQHQQTLAEALDAEKRQLR